MTTACCFFSISFISFVLPVALNVNEGVSDLNPVNTDLKSFSEVAKDTFPHYDSEKDI